MREGRDELALGLYVLFFGTFRHRHMRVFLVADVQFLQQTDDILALLHWDRVNRTVHLF
jgi:hypothetical protein